MSQHQFLLHPGVWIGQGKITFNESPDFVRIYTKWIVQEAEEGIIRCEQQVVPQSETEPMHNHFCFSEFTPASFLVELRSQIVGIVNGHGTIEPETISWEFKRQLDGNPSAGLEGFEVYKLQDNGEYFFHAEYTSLGTFRSIVNGRLWKK